MLLPQKQQQKISLVLAISHGLTVVSEGMGLLVSINWEVTGPGWMEKRVGPALNGKETWDSPRVPSL